MTCESRKEEKRWKIWGEFWNKKLGLVCKLKIEGMEPDWVDSLWDQSCDESEGGECSPRGRAYRSWIVVSSRRLSVKPLLNSLVIRLPLQFAIQNRNYKEGTARFYSPSPALFQEFVTPSSLLTQFFYFLLGIVNMNAVKKIIHTSAIRMNKIVN